MDHPPFSPTRRAAMGLFGAAAVLPRAALTQGHAHMSGTAFGTHWQLTGAPGAELARWRMGIEDLFAAIDQRLSPWRRDSAISQFNAGGREARITDPALIEVTAAALEIAGRTEGAFDPTVGPQVARWGFGPIRAGGAPDWRGLSIGAGGLGKSRADLTLDLCGIAKGWALDRAVERARTQGLRDFLFDLGGELVAMGSHPGGRDWRIAVEPPMGMGQSPAILRLPSGGAVATSGLTWQSFQHNARLYGHIIDPATGAPVQGGLRSVTVVAPAAMLADGWATALFAAGDTAGPDLAATHDVAALFLTQSGDGLRAITTGAIDDLILEGG